MSAITGGSNEAVDVFTADDARRQRASIPTLSATARESLEIREDTSDDISPPPNLSPYIAECSFWWKVAKAPLAFVAINILVFLILSWVMVLLMAASQQDQLNTLPWYMLVFAILYFLDGWLLYVASNFVQKQAQLLEEYDGTTVVGAAIRGSETLPDERRQELIYARVSQKLDHVLGRERYTTGSTALGSPTGRRCSVFASLLVLASVLFTGFGVVHVLQWIFIATIGHELCHMIGSSSSDIPNIPNDLQDWAKKLVRWDLDSEWSEHGPLIHTNDGATFVVSTVDVPSTGAATSSATDDAVTIVPRRRRGPLQSFSQPVLVAVPPTRTGQLQVLSNVIRPRSFVVLDESDAMTSGGGLRAPGFCCLYNTNASDYDTFNSHHPANMRSGAASIMCYYANSSDPSLVSQGLVRNVSLYNEGTIQNNKRHGESAVLLTMKWHGGCLWVGAQLYVNDRYVNEFFNITGIDTGGPLQLTPVTSETADGMLSCGQWYLAISGGGMAIVFMTASYWMTIMRVPPLAVGVVPAYVALVMLGMLLNLTLVATLSTAIAALSFAKLCGHEIVPWLNQQFSEHNNGEEWVWLLYSSIVAAVVAGLQGPHSSFERISGFALLATVLLGTILGHPILYLVGWIGGIGCVVIGATSGALPLILLGVIGGAGCVTVGKLLVRHRAHIKYYSQRAWRSIRTHISGSS